MGAVECRAAVALIVGFRTLVPLGRYSAAANVTEGGDRLWGPARSAARGVCPPVPSAFADGDPRAMSDMAKDKLTVIIGVGGAGFTSLVGTSGSGGTRSAGPPNPSAALP